MGPLGIRRPKVRLEADRQRSYAAPFNQAEAKADFNHNDTVNAFNNIDYPDFEHRVLTARNEAQDTFQDLRDMARPLSDGLRRDPLRHP